MAEKADGQARVKKALDILEFWHIAEFLDQPDIPSERDIARNAAYGRRDIICPFSGIPDVKKKTAADSYAYKNEPVAGNTVIVDIGRIKRRGFVVCAGTAFNVPYSILTGNNDYVSDGSFSLCRLRTDRDGMYRKGSVRPSQLIWVYTVWKKNRAADSGSFDPDIKGYNGLREELDSFIMSHAAPGQDKVPLPEFIAGLYEKLREALCAEDFEGTGEAKLTGSFIYTRYASGVRVPELFSVNGSPGTGKTVMLTELTADRVVKKAEIISGLNDPDELFERRSSSGGEYFVIKPEYDRLNDLSIIAAAMSNNAARNISAEMPLMKSPFGKFAGRGDYFSEYACSLLGREPGECWGLISAPLGNSANIAAYVKKVLLPLTGEENMSEESIALNRKLFAEEKEKFLAHHLTVTEMARDISEARSPESCPAFADLFSEDTDRYIAAQSTDPYMTDEYDEAREELFFRACMLMKELELGSRSLLTDLRIFGEMRLGTKPCDPAVMTGVFPALFLLTPLFSATLASFHTMMRGIHGSGVFGTLVVDEAGQSLPQFAVGAMYRAPTAFIVGDPKQLPPVVTEDIHMVSELIRQAMCAEGRDIPGAYSSKDISVQSLADSVNPYGRYIQGQWVGCPLSLHHRCADPMFTLSNRYSYGGTMIMMTGGVPSGSRFILPGSCWINISDESVNNITRNSQYMPEHGRAVLRLIMEAFRKVPAGTVADLFVISPFVTVAEGIKGYLEGFNWFRQDNVKRWAQGEHIGTVHTFQGKEAAEVIFAVGCNLFTAASVTGSVSRNLVNVAVTRAKYRLYVVGNGNACAESAPLTELREVLKDSEMTDDELNTRLTVLSRVDYGKCRSCGHRLVPMFMGFRSILTCPEPGCPAYRERGQKGKTNYVQFTECAARDL